MEGVLSSLAPARRRVVLAALALVVALVAAIGVVLIVRAVDASNASAPVSQAKPGPVLLVPGYGGSTGSLNRWPPRCATTARRSQVLPCRTTVAAT